jgi:DNA-binding ferritin-like protein
MNNPNPGPRQAAALGTPSGLSPNAVRDIPAGFTALLADMFALYIKRKNYHWHGSGPHFRDYHLLLDEQATKIFDTTTRSPSAPARSAERASAPSATSHARSGCSIMIRSS